MSLIRTDAHLLRALPTAGIVTIIGRKGSGKTVTGMRALEVCGRSRPCYLVGPPPVARRLVPDHVGIVQTVEELPNGCVALIDEAYIAFHAMDRGGSVSAARSKLLNLARQRGQLLIFITQDARQLDRYVIQATDVFLIKELTPVQVESERQELRKLLQEAKGAMDGITGDRKQFVYIAAMDPDLDGFVRVTVPSFWSEELSTMYGNPLALPGVQSDVGPRDLASMAKELHAQDQSYARIGRALNVSKATAYNLVNGYPYRDRESKRGPASAPRFASLSEESKSPLGSLLETWRREAQNGRPPTSD